MSPIGFLLTLTEILHLSSGANVDQSNFLGQLQQLAVDQLGIREFQRFIDDQKDARLSFTSSLPDGQRLAEQISKDIDTVVQDYIVGVQRLQTAYSNGQAISQIQLDLCCDLPSLAYSPKFKRPIDNTTVCHLTRADMSINVAVKNAMIENLNRLPGCYWQFYGTENGRHCTYPARNLCNESWEFDSRTRPWYTSTVNSPRDLVILIDRSTPMGEAYSSEQGKTKMTIARNVAAAVVKYLNPNDRVAVLAFSDSILSETGCFARTLAVANTDNVKKLQSFLEIGLSVDNSENRAQFEIAFRSASQVFNASDTNITSRLFADRDKSILLLTIGNQVEDCLRIWQLERDLFNNTVNIFVMEISEGTTDQTGCLKNLTAGPRGAHGFVPDSDFKDLRGQLGFYYNAFIDQIDRTNATFSVPFTDVNGPSLGLHTAVCLPLFLSDQTVSGVACLEITVDFIFNDIVNFHLGKLSYGFVIDRRGRVLLHPLLPQPKNWQDQPTLMELTNVEISSYSSDIEKKILSGIPGNQTVTIKGFSPIGQSDLHGVTKFDTLATYFWHSVPSMKIFMCLVIVQNELKSSLAWNSVYPSVFLSDEIDLNPNGKCTFFDRLSLNSNTTLVKLAAMTFQNQAIYTNQYLTYDLSQLKEFLIGKGAQPTNLPIKNGIRDIVASTFALESIWPSRAMNTQLKPHILARYIGMKEGVYRRYPPVRMSRDFDPTTQPWYKSAVAQKGSTGSSLALSFTLPFVDLASQVPIISLSQVVYNRSVIQHTPSDPIIGAMGMDVTVKYLYSLMSSTVDQCNRNGQECFAIDLGGFIVIHKDFQTTIPDGSLHIAAREKVIAQDLIQNRILTADACINYVSLPLTKQVFWKADVSFDSCQSLRSCLICKTKNSNVATNLFLVVKLSPSNIGSGNCSCNSQITDGSQPCSYDFPLGCQCPCRLPVDYDSCLTDLKIDPSTWKPCIPSGSPLLPGDVTSEERGVLSGLQSCLPCSTFPDEQLCEANGCCWLNEISICNQTCIDMRTSAEGSRQMPFSTSSPSTQESSFNSLTFGLAFGLTVSIVVMVTVAIAVVCCLRRLQTPPPITTYNNAYKRTSDRAFVTTVVVGDEVPREFTLVEPSYLSVKQTADSIISHQIPVPASSVV